MQITAWLNVSLWCVFIVYAL